eukprot:TRINITY_DN536_c0_g1_i5.p3 TRINITY_DN536_c0_g1~~TRINITY_DN536_c0_g1_i5.p3  ORF type:complete len:131 (-),score=49.06 TRINITY_DN536_c0_g1_i5:461-853(-)
MDADKKTKGEEEVQRQRKARIRLTCKNVQSIERVARELIKRAKDIQNVKVKGPVRIPTKILRITCRKTPCGEGTDTWDSLEMRIFKRVIDLTCTNEDLKAITSVKIDPGVQVDLTLVEDEDHAGDSQQVR